MRLWKRVAPLTTQSNRVVRIPDFIPGEEGDEVMFINPEELLLQKGKIDAPARAYRAHMKWQELYNKQ